MILVDSSVWVEHLKKGSAELRKALEGEEIFTHPLVLGELSLGNYKNRSEVLELLFFLPKAVVASDEEVLGLIEKSALYGKGLGWTDVNLIASSLLSRCKLWTYDKALISESKRMKLATITL